MECLILSQNASWKQKIGYKMSGTLRGEIWGLSFAATHSANIFSVVLLKYKCTYLCKLVWKDQLSKTVINNLLGILLSMLYNL